MICNAVFFLGYSFGDRIRRGDYKAFNVAGIFLNKPGEI